VVLSLAAGSRALAQSPSTLYTWPGTGNSQQWFKNFGTNTVTIDNTTAGELTITETGTAGAGVAITDDFNRVRESPMGPNGGLDLTGLDFLEFDFGHNGGAPVNVQFFVQASPSNTFVALGPDLAVTGGVNTYQVPLSGLTFEQQVYVRTLGFNARDHAANLTWTLREVRSGGTPLAQRTLVTHDTGTVEGGLQGAIVNFDGTSVQGNSGQNQTGLSHNPAGSGSLQWTDVAGGAGGAISWGNGTAWNGNGFNNRTTDLSNYAFVTVRMSAADAAGGGGTVDVQSFFQKNAFSSFQAAGILPLAIDGQFHDLTFSLAGLTDMNVVDQSGINLGTHPQTLVINVDSVRFDVPEPAAGALLGIAAVGCFGRRRRRQAE
jgi:PEP-CTERM motif